MTDLLDRLDSRLHTAASRIDPLEAAGWVSVCLGVGCLASAGSILGLTYVLKDVM